MRTGLGGNSNRPSSPVQPIHSHVSIQSRQNTNFTVMFCILQPYWSLLMPPGAMSLKIQVVFLFFITVENVHFNWIIGFSGTCDVFFCREQIQQRDAGNVLWQVYIVFLVVAIFAKTKCYSPSNLLVRSMMCHTSATYQLSTCRKWYVHHSKHSMIILVTKPISITPVLSLAQKASEKILPAKTITQGKSKALVENIFSYQSSYWGMSTLAVPVLFTIKPRLAYSIESCHNSIKSIP